MISREEYSIALQVINVKITKTGKFIEKGAKVQNTIPVTLGFHGYGSDQSRKMYKQTDNETVIKYLREKTSTNSTLPKAGRSWWQKLFGSE